MAWISSRIRAIARVAGTLIPGVILVAVFAVRAVTGLPPADPRIGASLAAADRLSLAADQLSTAVAAGGSGFTFTVVERSTLRSRAAGPLIEIPDPNDRYKSLGFASSYYAGSVIADGSVTPNGLWLEMRRGPASPDGAPDFDASPVTIQALTRSGVTWRNDGDGWYATDQPPGIGLDTQTIALLPSFLRTASNASVLGSRLGDGESRPDG